VSKNLYKLGPAIALICWQSVVRSQPAATFDVASLKVDTSGSRQETIAKGGTLTIHAATLLNLIEWAYDVAAYQVRGEDSTRKVRYEVLAKAAGPVPEAELKLMLQNLLGERLHLVIHRETRQTIVRTMTVGKRVPSLKTPQGNGPQMMYQENGRAMLTNANMAGLAALMSGAGPPPTVDRTGIQGTFDLAVDYRRYLDRAETMAQILTDALRDVARKQFGLRFALAKGPVEFLIIDQADKVPNGN
jgi:bla regulator protein BlaR1